jgi:hypothetical protein
MRNFFEAGIRMFRPAATPNQRKKIPNRARKQSDNITNATRCAVRLRTKTIAAESQKTLSH